MNQPGAKKRPDKSPGPSCQTTCQESLNKKSFASKRSVPSKSLAVSSGEVRQSKTKSKRVSHSPCLSAEELSEPVSKPRKSTKKSNVTANDCVDWSDQVGDVCEDDFMSRKSKAALSDCDSRCDGTGDDSRNSSGACFDDFSLKKR